MKVLVSRVSRGRVEVRGPETASIGRGLAVFVGIEKGDSAEGSSGMADKVANLRIFENEQGKFYYSVKEKKCQVLCVSNFTLCANTEKGRRPSFDAAMPPQEAKELFLEFVVCLRAHGLDVQTGEFGEHMDIDLEMDGPVNIILTT